MGKGFAITLCLLLISSSLLLAGNHENRFDKPGKSMGKIKTNLEIVENNNSEPQAITSDGKKHKIKINSEKVKEILRERFGAENVSNISLEEVRHKNIPRVVFKVNSTHSGRFLGIFKMALKVQSQMDPETGDLLDIKVPWWAFLLTGLEIPDGLPGKNNETDDGNETENNAPVITSTPNTTIAENASYSYQVTATDVDTNDTLTYSLTQNPEWISINSSIGLVEGTTPLVDNNTNYTINIKVSDGIDFDTQTYNLTVTNSTS